MEVAAQAVTREEASSWEQADVERHLQWTLWHIIGPLLLLDTGPKLSLCETLASDLMREGVTVHVPG